MQCRHARIGRKTCALRGHGPHRLGKVGEGPGGDAGRDRGTERPGLGRDRHRHRDAEHVGEDLRPDHAPRAAAGQRRPLEPDAGGAQHLDMAAVLEGNALEQGTQHVPFVMPAGEAVEAGAEIRPLPRAVEEGVEERVVGGGGDGRDAAAAGGEGVAPPLAALDQLPHVPFEIGGRGGARFDRHHPPGIEGGDHEDARVDDRGAGHDLVDAPRAGDDRGLSRLDDARAERIGDDVEEAGGDGRALGEAGHRRGRGRHPPCDLGRPEEVRQERAGVAEAIGGEEVAVIAAVGEPDETRAAHVRDVGRPPAGEAPGDVVLAVEGGAGSGVAGRVLRLQPGEEGRRLRRPGLLEAEAVQAGAVARRAKPVRGRRRTAVEGLDGKERPARTVEEIEAVAVAGAADGGDGAGADPGPLDAVADHARGVGPELVQVALDMAGCRPCRRADPLARGERAAGEVEQHRLDDGVAGIEAEEERARLRHVR